MTPIGIVCGSCGQAERGAQVICSRCGADSGQGAPVARVCVREGSRAPGVIDGHEVDFIGEWPEDRRGAVVTAVARLFSASDRPAQVDAEVEPLISQILPLVSMAAQEAYSRATDERLDETERNAALGALYAEHVVLRDALLEQRKRGTGGIYSSSLRLWTDASTRSSELARRAHRAELDGFARSADACLRATCVTDLPPLLREHAALRFASRTRADLEIIATGIDDTWGSLRSHLIAAPGSKSVEIAKALELPSGVLATFTHRMAGTGALRRETLKNRVHLWYVGETIDPVMIRDAWKWIAEVR